MFRKLCEEGRLGEAVQAVKLMDQQGSHISTSILFNLVQGCIKKKDLTAGRKVNSLVMGCGFEFNTFLGSHLIHMFASCGSLVEANKIFSKLPEPSVFSWNAIISAHTKLGQGDRAIELYHTLARSSLRPNEYIFVAVLKACASTAALTQGDLIHYHIIQLGCEKDLFVGNTLMDMYAKCGSLEDARRVFDTLKKRDVVSWNTIITGYAQHSHVRGALQLFQEMQQEGIQADDVTFTSVVKACSSMTALNDGKIIHNLIIGSGFELDIFVGNILIDMYMACCSVEDAHTVFEKLQKRDVVTWSTMISGYAQHAHGHKALEIFDLMCEEGINPNNVTYPSVLKACSSVSMVDKGKQIHTHIIENEFNLDVYIGSALIDMYAKCGSLEDARTVFDSFPRPNAVTLNSMIGAYTQHGQGEEALQLFEQLQQVGIAADSVTFVSALKACSFIAALDRGRLIHGQIMGSGFAADLSVGNTLIDMYSKCGSLVDSCVVFQKMQTRGVVTWSAMIAGYALHSDYQVVLQHFEEMHKEGLRPNDVTFVSLISACNQKGLVDEGYHHFQSMRQIYGITPTHEHYNCMVDLLGRAGRLTEAEGLIFTMPFQCKFLGWKSLLSHCKTYSNVDLARRCFDHIVTINSADASVYVIMSDIYINSNMWDDAYEIQVLKKRGCVWKTPGKAFIQIDDRLHDFIVGDESHPRSAKIYGKLKNLTSQMKEDGFVP